jgi:chaperone modulatory protein CbpM
MQTTQILCGVVLDGAALSLDDLARACAMEPDWVAARVEAGLIGAAPAQPAAAERRFGSADLMRAQRLAFAERVFGADEHAAALMADLIEEVERLRRIVARAGLG